MKVYKIILCSIILPFAIASCKQAPVEVSSVSLNTATVEMVEGDTYSLVATVLPSNAEYEGISWASSNTSVASVNQGTVTALKEGKTTITASAGGKSATCSVTVSAKYIAVTSITLDMNELSLKVGSSDVLIATVKPDDATDKSVQWSSSDATVVKVDNGKVTALKSGTAIITAKAGSCSAECIITASIDTESITLDKSEMTLNVGETATLAASITPADATDQNITWTSSNTNVASVNNGTVKALKAGTAIITAECSGKEAECVVIVLVPTDSVTLDKTSLELPVGDSYTLTATVKPDNAADKNVIWSSSDQSVASVTNGKVTALKQGTATIIAECSGKKAECKVTVTVPVSGISLDRSELSIAVGESTTLTATITPADATDKTVTWASSKPDIASVDKGTIKALKAGTATITAECNGKKAECKVTVTVPITGISLDKSELTLAVGEVSTLKATVTPSDATDKSITWTSSNTSVATVKGGTITALKGGTTTITAECGGKKAECKVVVTIPVSGIYLDKETLSIAVGETSTLKATITPANATNQTITWTSSNEGIVKVNEGTVKGVQSGTATITAVNSGFSASCSVTVTMADNVITYTSTDGKVVTPYNIYAFGVNIISNEYTDGLGTIVFDGPVTMIGSCAFEECKLKTICLPNTVTRIEEEAFRWNYGLEYIDLSESLSYIGYSAFSMAKLSKLICPASLRTIDDTAFFGVPLKEIKLNNGLKSIGTMAFGSTDITEIVVPGTVTSLWGCFSGCELLKTAKFEEGFTHFEAGAIGVFSGCKALTEVIFPSTLVQFASIFQKCVSLTNVYFKSVTPPECVNYKKFFSDSYNVTVWVPKSAVETYKSNSWWGYWADKIKGYDY